MAKDNIYNKPFWVLIPRMIESHRILSAWIQHWKYFIVISFNIISTNLKPRIN